MSVLVSLSCAFVGLAPSPFLASIDDVIRGTDVDLEMFCQPLALAGASELVKWVPGKDRATTAIGLQMVRLSFLFSAQTKKRWRRNRALTAAV